MTLMRDAVVGAFLFLLWFGLCVDTARSAPWTELTSKSRFAAADELHTNVGYAENWRFTAPFVTTITEPAVPEDDDLIDLLSHKMADVLYVDSHQNFFYSAFATPRLRVGTLNEVVEYVPPVFTPGCESFSDAGGCDLQYSPAIPQPTEVYAWQLIFNQTGQHPCCTHSRATLYVQGFAQDGSHLLTWEAQSEDMLLWQGIFIELFARTGPLLTHFGAVSTGRIPIGRKRSTAVATGSPPFELHRAVNIAEKVSTYQAGVRPPEAWFHGFGQDGAHLVTNPIRPERMNRWMRTRKLLGNHEHVHVFADGTFTTNATPMGTSFCASPADFDGDCTVGMADFGVFIQEFMQ